MREHKYRIWNKTDKVMINLPNSPRMVNGELVCDDDDILLEYTGLQDKNGVEIYEGDICTNSTGRICRCDYFEPGACFDFTPLNENGCNSGYEAQMWKYRLTVIGNIHENPELLK